MATSTAERPQGAHSCSCGKFTLPKGRRDLVYAHPEGGKSDQHGPRSCEQIKLGAQQAPVLAKVERHGWNLNTGRWDRPVTEEAYIQRPRAISFRRLDR